MAKSNSRLMGITEVKKSEIEKKRVTKEQGLSYKIQIVGLEK
jgi:hypothetical protein